MIGQPESFITVRHPSSNTYFDLTIAHVDAIIGAFGRVRPLVAIELQKFEEEKKRLIADNAEAERGLIDRRVDLLSQYGLRLVEHANDA